MNIDWSLVVSLIAAAGLGSVFTTLLQHQLSQKTEQKKLEFGEKKQAFIGLLEALQRAAMEPSDMNSKAFAYWQTRCDLVASQAVRKLVQRIVDTNGQTIERQHAFDALLAAMRADLGFGKATKRLAT